MLWIPVLLAFAAVGWLVGWLTGASNSPVVGAILPLFFGLVGATAYGMLDRHAKLGGLTIPLHSFFIVSGNPATFCIHEAQVGLSLCVPLLCSFSIPLHCLTVILGNTPTVFVVQSQIVLTN